jgi:hypothetical protein
LIKNLNDKTYINIQEVGREELISVFEILHEKGLINKHELQKSVFLANEKYKSVKHLDYKFVNTEN